MIQSYSQTLSLTSLHFPLNKKTTACKVAI